MHIKNNGQDVFQPHLCGGFLADQQKSGICVCSATQAEHGAGGLPHGVPDFAATQNTAVTSFLSPIPGPSRTVADTSPITHVFPPHQSLGGTVNERRVNSTARATIRNRGGIPSPASPPKRPAHVPYRSNGRTAPPHLRQNPPLKLTVLFLPLYMKELQVQHKSDLPADFIQKFWIEPGADFDSFLQRFQAHDLLFSVEVPDEDSDRHAASNAINEQLRRIYLSGGPKLLEPEGNLAQAIRPPWEFLTCKEVMVKGKDLRGGPKEKRKFVVIKTSSKMLAPVEYSKVKAIVKQFGIKNTLRENEDEPDKLVVIGARYPGHCPASIKDVYCGDFDEGDDNIIYPHGCYVYRLLWGLTICGENTKRTFDALLKRCRRGCNAPMCHFEQSISDDESVPDETPTQGLGHEALQLRAHSVVSISSSESEHEIPSYAPSFLGARHRASPLSSRGPQAPPVNQPEVAEGNVTQGFIGSLEPHLLTMSQRPQHPSAGPLAPCDDPEMLHRIELPRSAAVETSNEHWPHRLKGSCDPTGYLQWHEKVRPGGGLHQRNRSGQSADLRVQGKSTKDLSQKLISRMDHFHRTQVDPDSTSSPDYQVPEGTPHDFFGSLGVFFNSLRYYIVEIPGGANMQISTGDGPERATLQQVIQVLLEDRTSWLAAQDGSGWARPAFTPALSSEHQIRWRTTGTFILIHLLTLGNGPEPVSPFLVYLLLAAASLRGDRSLNNKDVLISLESLYQLDYGIADILRPWMVLTETDQLLGFAGGQTPHPITSVQNVLNQFEYQLNTIRGNRDRDEHESWTSALVAMAFLGCADPWEKPQFRCLLEGFMTPLATGMTATELLKHTHLSPLAITLSSYNRRIEAVRDLEQLFTFKTIGGHHRLTRQQADSIAEGFKNSLFRYLNGTGHVPGMASRYVTAEEYHLRESDRLFRAKLTLQQFTDSWLLPVGDDAQSKIKVTLDIGQLYAPANNREVAMNISTCSRDTVVPYTPWLHKVILDTLEERGIRFDRWIHSQLICNLDTSEYNSL